MSSQQSPTDDKFPNHKPKLNMPQSAPELRKYIDKRVRVIMNCNRKVTGLVRGFDIFLNLVLDDAVDEQNDGGRVQIGMIMIRGQSVIMIEPIDRIDTEQRQGGR